MATLGSSRLPSQPTWIGQIQASNAAAHHPFSEISSPLNAQLCNTLTSCQFDDIIVPTTAQIGYLPPSARRRHAAHTAGRLIIAPIASDHPRTRRRSPTRQASQNAFRPPSGGAFPSPFCAQNKIPGSLLQQCNPTIRDTGIDRRSWFDHSAFVAFRSRRSHTRLPDLANPQSPQDRHYATSGIHS